MLLNYNCGVCKKEFLSDITPERIKEIVIFEFGAEFHCWICPTCKEVNPNIKTIK